MKDRKRENVKNIQWSRTWGGVEYLPVKWVNQNGAKFASFNRISGFLLTFYTGVNEEFVYFCAPYTLEEF